MKFLSSVDFNNLQSIKQVLENLATEPSGRSVGSVFFDTALNVPKYYNGTSWKLFGVEYSASDGLKMDSNVIKHDVNVVADTASSANPTHGGTFTAIDSATRDLYGHITKLNVKTIKLPAQYVHPTTAGNKHIPSGGVSGDILKWSADGTAAWVAEYSVSDGLKIDSNVIKHDVSVVADTASAASATHGGTFTAVDSVTRDSYGHIKTLNVKTITLPAQYVHPTTSGNKHIPSGGAAGQILKWASDGTASWGTEYSYTHPAYEAAAATIRAIGRDATGHVVLGDAITDLVLKFDSGTTENTSLYTFNGSAAKTIDIKGGSNVTLTKAAGSITISSTDTKNTAGSSNSTNKIYLIGATSQATSAQTYSNTGVYATNGALVAASFNGITFTADKPTSLSSDLTVPTSKAVYSAIIDAIAESDAMVFVGTVGSSGDITTLPTTGFKIGHTYKVVTAGTYTIALGETVVAKVGDLFIGKTLSPYRWSYVPSGDEAVTILKYITSGTPSLTTSDQTGTITLGSAAIKFFETTLTTSSDNHLPTSKAIETYLSTTYVKTITATSPIVVTRAAGTSTVALSHANSGVSAATYGPSANATLAFGGTFKVPKVTVDATGHVTSAATYTFTLPSLTAAAIRALVKVVASNGALTGVGGICTWTITNTLGTADVTVSIRENASGELVYADTIVATDVITIKIYGASVTANTYTATIIG